MKCATFLAFAASAMAAALPQATTSKAVRFFGQNQSSGPLHFAAIAANGGKLWFGRKTVTDCPGGSAINCAAYTSNETIFDYDASKSTLFLDAALPGGQQVYVTAGDKTTGASAGEVRFIQPKLSPTQPALLTGFSIKDGTLQFECRDWYACSSDGTDGPDKEYQIWAAARLEVRDTDQGCIPFAWTIEEVQASHPQAWQYY